ncbi:PaaI family thioesterase [Paenibacillus albus]|uniref:PaaI family thioesterase n=1 Tax=Paenibacillus albus TaxID=2495582 RepID=A0A3S9A148_9BACL|nr:PaaI family thioesterase [Paenibacillus albus]AZN39451.1 PaaI family thioesterase [Paenibacillus albus]
MNEKEQEVPRPRDELSRLNQLAEAAKPTFWGYLGCELVHASPGKCGISLQVRPEHLNLAHIVHGGVLASLLDNAMGLVVILECPGEKTVTTQLNVHYLQSAGQGEIRCEAVLIHKSRRTLTLQGSIVDNNGELLAWGSGTFRRVT